MPHVRAQVTFQGGTNLPEDRFVNTFHFDQTGAGTLALAVAAIDTPLKDFYLGPTPTSSLGAYLSVFVKRAATIRYYDMDIPKDTRVPVITNFTLPAVGSASTIPEEAAVCLSFSGVPPVTPSKRGRIYLGPLNTTAMEHGTITTSSSIVSALRTRGTGAMNTLALSAAGWCIYSPTNDNYVNVVSGFVDSAFDTQRRRGPDAVARSVWALV